MGAKVFKKCRRILRDTIDLSIITSGNVEIEVRNQIRQKNATICSKASVLANNLRFELEDGALLMKFNTAVNLVDYDLWIWNSSVPGGETSWVECGQH